MHTFREVCEAVRDGNPVPPAALDAAFARGFIRHGSPPTLTAAGRSLLAQPADPMSAAARSTLHAVAPRLDA